MRTRWAIISAALLAAAASAAAEPSKPATQTTQPADHSTVLASADHLPAPAQPAVQEQKRPRAMRVTTCRCADQIVEPAEAPKAR